MSENNTGEDAKPIVGCPVKIAVRRGRWIAEVQDVEACKPTIADMKNLGPEARANLARHLETSDPQLGSDIGQMRKRGQ